MAKSTVYKTVTTDESPDRPAERPTSERPQNILERLIWLVAGIIIALLAFRFILSLLGANRANGFANFIYDVSHPFAAPFFGLFNYNNINYGVSRVEVYTLVAMAVYAVVAWGLSALVDVTRR